MTALDHKVPPLVVVALVGAGMWAVRGLGPQLPLSSGVKYMSVGILVAAGLVFIVLGVRAFRASSTTVNPLEPAQASSLVTTGVYRVTRNPMYVGMALVLLGWAVQLAAVVAFAGVVVFILYMTRFQIQPEERALVEIFGAEYSSYASRVRRWL